MLALSILSALAAAAGVFGHLPLSLAATLLLFSALGSALAGMMLADARRLLVVFEALARGMAASGLLAVATGALQVFLPDWVDGRLVAVSALEGRATGNLRQPNHLGSLLLWALVGVVVLWEIKKPRLFSSLASQAGALWLVVATLVLGIVLSASRTAATGLLVLAAWGLLDRRLSRLSRLALLTTPLVYTALWHGLTLWADATGHAFGGTARFSVQTDISSSRFGIWANTLALIAHHPWTGVGWGEFNFAWSLTPFPHRPVAFFDHTHNLVLQLAVEIGIPLTLVVLCLLCWAFWRVVAIAWRAPPGPQAVVLRGGAMMLLLMALHSMLEYPLWYAYFLLPTAFLWGLCLGPDGHERGDEGGARRPVSRMPPLLLAGLRAGALLMVILGGATVLDYWRVVVIFVPPEGAAPLAQRIEQGKRSLLFSHHAYYAAATSAAAPEDVGLDVFKVTTHHLLDTRLMIAWSKALYAQGDVERARHLAARLREFRNPNSKAFFEPCDRRPPPGEGLPFQCAPPGQTMDWRDFR